MATSVLVSPIRVSHGKAAEFQARGAVHFHVLLRLDGIDPDDLDAVIPPPPGITAADLDDAIHHAAQAIQFTTPRAPRAVPDGWLIEWGNQVDVRVITMRGGNPVTDAMVAGYLAKYSTKGTEITGHVSARITDDTVDLYADPDGSHTERLIHACWILGREPRLSRTAPLGTHARLRRPLPHQRTPLLRHLRSPPQRPHLLPAQRDNRARTRPDPHRRPHRRRNHPHHWRTSATPEPAGKPPETPSSPTPPPTWHAGDAKPDAKNSPTSKGSASTPSARPHDRLP